MEQLKRDSPYSSNDPEQPKFERAVGKLERILLREIVCLRERRWTIAFCGTLDADKSLFLDALLGWGCLPSDSESHNLRMPHTILSIIVGFPSTALPCRLRHVEGQKSTLLQCHAETFRVALKNLQDHQYGRKMQTYPPPPENMPEALLLSDALSDPSDEEI